MINPVESIIDLITPNGNLDKLTITAFSTADCTPAKVLKNDDGKPRQFKAMFNPTTFVSKREIEFAEEKASGQTDKAQKIYRQKESDFTIELLIDGTGASGGGGGIGEMLPVSDPITGAVTKIPSTFVDEQVKIFKKVAVEYEGELHRPAFLLIQWGVISEKCVLKSYEITYTLFNSQGRPLRAKIVSTFSSVKSIERQEAEKATSSPDITHVRTATDSDRLPLMTHKILENYLHYLEVARANDLDNFRRLSTGKTIFFPPVIEQVE